MTFRVRFALRAEADLDRLFDFLLLRELDSSAPDLDVVRRARQAIDDAIKLLSRTPFSCRKAGDNPFLRELVIPFGHTGYVALFEIVSDAEVVVLAIRHQREDDYH